MPYGYNTQQLDDQKILVYSDNSTDLPIVEFKLTEGKVCANPSEVERSKGRYNYKLLHDPTVSKCSESVGEYSYNPRFKKISTIREDRLYEDNGVDRVIDNLPNYPIKDSEKYNWNLYYTTYNHWSAECDKYGYDKAHLLKFIDTTDKVDSIQSTLVWICFFQMIICCFIIEGIILHYKV